MACTHERIGKGGYEEMENAGSKTEVNVYLFLSLESFSVTLQFYLAKQRLSSKMEMEVRDKRERERR